MTAPKVKRSPSGELLVERFSTPRRIEHIIAIITFATLVITGLPQKFDGSNLGHWIIGALGGLDHTRYIHRIAGVVFSVHAVAHIMAFVVGLLTRKMRMSLIPVPQDLRDAWQNLMFYLGRVKKPPRLPKFDYRQKFEYIGMVMGGLVMVFSGLILMYPMEIARMLPGETIPAALVAHSSEAVLALLVLVVWHMYSVILSPDVFPLDTSMFTGYMTAEELKHHHRAEYDEVFPDGQPDELAGELESVDLPKPRQNV
ncbi:MAG: cytochrome b/b6 domain-containing protein [Myxococcales bacterium]|nr:cytochrome b/b6 domain-containing protein [Myxococcales bacterium]